MNTNQILISFIIPSYNEEKTIVKVLNRISETIVSNLNIVGYGAPAKATTALNYFNITNELDYIIEDNPLKNGKFVPGVRIKIQDKKNQKDKAKCILVLAWNFFNEIKEKNKNLTDNFISIKSLEKD